MNDVRKKFVLLSTLSVFAMVLVLLGIINVLNFTMAARDADQITLTLSENAGSFSEAPAVPNGQKGKGNSLNIFEGNSVGPMGPQSPDMASSMRYFTCLFDEEKQAQIVSYHLSAVSEEEAADWAESLRKSIGDTGWTRTTYRYRIYKVDGVKYITVIDQGRELLPSYRILTISVIGGLLGVLISFLILQAVSKRVFKPLMEADTKQKKFLEEAEQEFKVPLTVINANTEIIEREHGETDQTRTINRQVKRLMALLKELGSVTSVYEEKKNREAVDISNTFLALTSSYKAKYEAAGRKLATEIEPDIVLNANVEAVARLFEELLKNGLAYSTAEAGFSLKRVGERIQITASNDCLLEEGTCDQVFDRFTRLANADGHDGVGMGLAYVKEIVRELNGRQNAKVENGRFILTISL